MIRFILSFAMFISLCSVSYGQEVASPIAQYTVENYEEVYSYENWYDNDLKPGTHYFMITASWCYPCRQIKSEMVKRGLESRVVYIDKDKQRKVADYFANSFNHNGSIPFFFKLDLLEIESGRFTMKNMVFCGDRNYIEFILDNEGK